MDNLVNIRRFSSNLPRRRYEPDERSFNLDKCEEFELAFEKLALKLIKRYSKRIPGHFEINRRKLCTALSGNQFEIDFVLEWFRPDSTNAFFTVLIECKNYKKRISSKEVNDIAMKLDLLNAQKGILVSSHGFSEGCIKIARYYRISLLKFIPPRELVWIVE